MGQLANRGTDVIAVLPWQQAVGEHDIKWVEIRRGKRLQSGFAVSDDGDRKSFSLQVAAQQGRDFSVIFDDE